MPVGAVAQFMVALSVGWVVGGHILRAFDRYNTSSFDLGWAERALMAVVGSVAWTVALMVLNIVTGGAVFGSPWVVPIAALATLWSARRRVRLPSRVPWAKVAVFALLLFAVFVLPAVIGGSGVRTGDPPWHLGWTEQLLAGEPVPVGPAPELARNAYPWGLHAFLAALVRLVPGTDPLVAYESLHLFVVIAIPLAAAGLARRVDPRAGWAAAAAASLVGGFGWLVAREPDFVASPSQARFGADLVVASPNSVYEMFPSGAPRELGLVLLGALGIALMTIVRSPARRSDVAAGSLGGLVGVVSVPMFVTALCWLLATVVMSPRGSRAGRAARMFGPALAVFALWFGPVLSNYLRFGGFVNITPQLGKEWPLAVALAAWGLLLPAAVLGIVLCARSEHGPARHLLGLGIAVTVLLGIAVARGAFEWDLAGNATLLHQGRIWPVAHLLGSVLAGLAIVRAFSWLRRRGAALAFAGAAIFFLLGLASPVLAAVHLTDLLKRDAAGFVYDSEDLAPGSFVRDASEHLGPEDVVEVRGSDDLAFALWQFSGVRLADYDDPRLSSNELRIRYAGLARAWDHRMAVGGFPPDLVVEPVPPAGVPASAIVVGSFEGDAWMLYEAP